MADGAEGPRTRALAAALSAAAVGIERGQPRVAPLPIPVRGMSSTLVCAEFSQEQELLQLTDLLLGAVSTAILPRGVAATKLWFAREMARMMEQLRQPADERTPGAQGHLLVSYFPDPLGRVYRDGQLGIWEL
jgi:hypothetical protein